MYSLLAKNVIYPLADLALGSSVMKYYYWLQKTQWWSPERLQELQNIKLQVLIKHAYENVPYYRRIFGERGLTDKDIQTVDDLPQLPVLTKNQIRQNLPDMLARDYLKWKPFLDFTGGSTGEPMKYYINKNLASIGWAGMFRGWGWAGYKIGDKRISFGGSSLVPDKAPTRFEIIRRKLERNLPLSAVSMNEARYNQHLNTINSYRPKFIYGYPSSIYLLADYCKSHGIKNIHFDAVFTTAEVLLPDYRTAIESQFQCKVFDQYGSYDGGGQALECEAHQGLHISVEKAVMEIVDDDGRKVSPGNPGRIIVTDLHNYAMPFVRYEVGDVGVMADRLCTCGRGLPVLKTVEGRTTDIIKLSNGVSIAGPAVVHLFRDCHVKQFQLVQTAKDELLVRVVKDIDYSEKDTEYFMSILRHHAGKEIKIGLEFCDRIPVGENSKYRFILSTI